MLYKRSHARHVINSFSQCLPEEALYVLMRQERCLLCCLGMGHADIISMVTQRAVCQSHRQCGHDCLPLWMSNYDKSLLLGCCR